MLFVLRTWFLSVEVFLFFLPGASGGGIQGGAGFSVGRIDIDRIGWCNKRFMELYVQRQWRME